MLPPFQEDWALFVDLDGTLLDLVDRPEDARARPGVIEVLRSLERRSGGALALVSGRSLVQIDEILEPLVLPAAGQHGYERRRASGNVSQAATNLDVLSKLRESFLDFARSHPGTFVEEKGASMALHYRRAPSAESDLLDLARSLAGALPEQFRMQRGKMVLEVKPSGRTKGTAIEAFMEEEPFRGRRPVFLGDDVTDEDGFRFVNATDGISIKVGSGETEAQFRLPNVAAVVEWLERYDQFLENAS